MNDNDLQELTESRMALADAISGTPEQLAEARAKHRAIVQRLFDDQDDGTGAEK
jgi:hypothetical protein